MIKAGKIHQLLRFWKTSAAYMKIRTKLLLLIVISGICCLFLFRFLWIQKWTAWGILTQDFPIRLSILPRMEDDFYDKLANEAPKYNIPESEDDEEAIEAMAPFLDLVDDYTAIYIYGAQDGLFRTGYMPNIMNNSPFRTFFDIGYNWTEGVGERIAIFPLQFKNGYATVHIASYHSTCFLFPYFIFCFVLCIALFLSSILYFVSKKMKSVVRLKETILRMSSGDLVTPVRCTDKDELGILAQELDRLRATLDENLKEEQALHKSNQELIAALSHDLRTPLTILKGYLEILHLNRNTQMQTEYVQRCIRKADDIQEMTDRMFEYALVYDVKHSSAEQVSLVEVPLENFLNSLKEHEDFLHLAGFQTKFYVSCAVDSSICMMTDPSMLKRVWNNLFSNIIKYADKKESVSVSVEKEKYLVIAIKNKIKTGCHVMESTQIGLKSVRKMMELMDGELIVEASDSYFTAELRFP